MRKFEPVSDKILPAVTFGYNNFGAPLIKAIREDIGGAFAALDAGDVTKARMLLLGLCEFAETVDHTAHDLLGKSPARAA